MHGGFPATPPGAPACRPACPVTAPVAAGGGLHLVYVPPSPRGCSFLLAPLPPHLLVWAHWPPLTLLPGPGPGNCHVGFRGCLGFPTVTSLSLPHGPREPRAMVPALPGLSGSPWACPCASWPQFSCLENGDAPWTSRQTGWEVRPETAASVVKLRPAGQAAASSPVSAPCHQALVYPRRGPVTSGGKAQVTWLLYVSCGALGPGGAEATSTAPGAHVAGGGGRAALKRGSRRSLRFNPDLVVVLRKLQTAQAIITAVGAGCAGFPGTGCPHAFRISLEISLTVDRGSLRRQPWTPAPGSGRTPVD